MKISPEAPNHVKTVGAPIKNKAVNSILNIPNKIIDIPKYFFARGISPLPTLMEYSTAPPIPIPVPTACKNAVSGNAILTAAKALSPNSLPTK